MQETLAEYHEEHAQHQPDDHIERDRLGSDGEWQESVAVMLLRWWWIVYRGQKVNIVAHRQIGRFVIVQRLRL